MRRMLIRRTVILLAVATWGAATVHADVALHGLFQDHMVLQREMPVKVFGTASPGERVKVAFNNQWGEAQADAQGKWLVTLPAMKAGGAFEMTVTGKNMILLKDILIGVVWVAAGQSNMVMPVKAAAQRKQVPEFVGGVIRQTVVVSSPEVPQPLYVRYAFATNPECNLYNKEGLPALPFLIDDGTAPASNGGNRRQTAMSITFSGRTTGKNMDLLAQTLKTWHSRYDAQTNMLREEVHSPGYHTTLHDCQVHPTLNSLQYAIGCFDVGDRIVRRDPPAHRSHAVRRVPGRLATGRDKDHAFVDVVLYDGVERRFDLRTTHPAVIGFALRMNAPLPLPAACLNERQLCLGWEGLSLAVAARPNTLNPRRALPSGKQNT